MTTTTNDTARHELAKRFRSAGFRVKQDWTGESDTYIVYMTERDPANGDFSVIRPVDFLRTNGEEVQEAYSKDGLRTPGRFQVDGVEVHYYYDHDDYVAF